MIVRERKRKGTKKGRDRRDKGDREGDKLDMIPPDTAEEGLTWAMSLGSRDDAMRQSLISARLRILDGLTMERESMRMIPIMEDSSELEIHGAFVLQ